MNFKPHITYFVTFRSRSRVKTMEEIKLHVEQVSRQSFIEGWAKAEPSIVNQISF